MARTLATEAIVLRTVDVGEADRLCVLLTREHGRLAARASGARKLHSRLGGSLLPLQRVTVQLTETRTGMRLSGVQLLRAPSGGDTAHWCSVLEGVELLLQLTEDGHPMPDIYGLLGDYLEREPAGEGLHLAFTLRLLHILGLLPVDEDMPVVADLSTEARSTLLHCAAEAFPEPLPKGAACRDLRLFVSRLLEQHLTRPLKARAVRLSVGDPVRGDLE